MCSLNIHCRSLVMKRHNRVDFNTSDTLLKFQDVFSSLQDFNRHELISIIDESNRLLALECSEITSTVPEEVWQSIFLKACEQKKSFEFYFSSTNRSFPGILIAKEKLLRRLGCVSRSFSVCVHAVIQICFDGNYSFSNWVLSHLPVVETSLNLSCNSWIEDGTLAKLTHLQSLQLNDPWYYSIITESSLSLLTNLTELSVENNTKITDLSVNNLTNLTKLKAFNSSITEVSLQTLTNLRSLEGSWRFADDTIAKLSYLTTLTCHSLSTREAKSFTQLKSLSIYHPSQECFPFLTQLTEIKIHGGDVYDGCLMLLTNLSILDIKYCSAVSNKGVKNLTQLTHLNIASTEDIDNHGISGLTNLTFLNLSFHYHRKIDTREFKTSRA